MPPEPEVVTTGTVLKRGDGATPEVFTAVPGVFNITPPTQAREKIPTTDLLDTATRHKLGIIDNGDVTVQYNWLPDNATQEALLTDHAAGTLRNFKLEYPDKNGSAGAGGTDSFAAYVMSVSREAVAINGRLTRTAVLSISGAVTES